MTAKCQSCGSRQFVTHESRRICAYCRGEAEGDGMASYLGNRNDLMAERMSMAFGYSILRADKEVKIKVVDAISEELERLGLTHLS